MSVLTWLLGKTPDDTDPAPTITLPETARQVAPPAPETEDIAELEEPDEDGNIELEAVFCIIDYEDANGVQTRRRITLRKASRGPHAPILSAVCHERRALRHFRCDRIECFIEETGEVINPVDFFRETLAIDLASLAPLVDEANQNARAIRDFLRPPLSLLVAVARSDGDFHPEELDEICQYAEKELMCKTSETRFPNVTIDDLDSLTILIRKMRPGKSSISGYYQKTLEMADERLERFAEALQRLVMADGRLAYEEEEILEELNDIRARLDRPPW